MKVGSLFSGIGGLDLGLARAGMEIAWQCEISQYCRMVLQKTWPDVYCYRKVEYMTEFDEEVDLICGGFPCQPVSVAGLSLGREDRRWLWPEFYRVIELYEPRWILIENVPGLLEQPEFPEILSDLSAGGYDAEWDCLPASAFGAPHRRFRVFIVAYNQRLPKNRAVFSGAKWNLFAAHLKTATNVNGGGRSESFARSEYESATEITNGSLRDKRSGEAKKTSSKEKELATHCAEWWLSEPDLVRMGNGVPERVDRIKSLGNSVVPQVAHFIGMQILEIEKEVSSGVARSLERA